MSKHTIKVKGVATPLVMMHAHNELEDVAGGTIISDPPIEERSMDAVVDAVTTIVVVFDDGLTTAVDLAGKAALIKAFVDKMRVAGGVVDVEDEDDQ